LHAQELPSAAHRLDFFTSKRSALAYAWREFLAKGFGIDVAMTAGRLRDRLF
jgi:hypothetical protein